MAVLAYAVFVLALVALDQLTKFIAVAKLAPVDSVSFIPGVLSLTYVENRGMAFSLLQGNVLFLVVITAVILFFAFYVVLKNYMHSRVANCLMLLIISGGVGNLLDRAFRGFVVDFFQFLPVDFPVFNVADCYITVGVIALLVYLFFINPSILREDSPHGK